VGPAAAACVSELVELIFRATADITAGDEDEVAIGVLVPGGRSVHEAAAAARLRVALLAHRAGVVADFIANAGGVICAAMEYRGATRAAAFAAIEEKIRANTGAVLDAARTKRVSPRRAALDLATAEVNRAMSYRRFSIF
jgi:glutamate dehydrogenase/leucine dehydrogenase